MRPPFRAAFTLIELLVVISIIAILAGLVLPVISRMSVSANITKSVSNQRVIAVAVMTHANDKGYLPGPTWTTVSSPEYEATLPEAEQAKNLRRLLMPYIPEDKKVWTGSNPKTKDFTRDQVVFMLNNRTTTQPRRFFGYPSSGEPTPPLPLLQVVASGRAGTPGFEANTPGRIWMLSDPDNLNCNQLPPNDKNFAPINGGRVYVFFDGHAAFLKDKDRPGNADQRGP